LLGVTFGGLLENLCVVGGIKSLSLLTLLLYLLSALPAVRLKLFPYRKHT
jgi:hypothetical protein